ncbi:urate hydroxylase PuuD [Microvirga antarctica]|uniref:urate hydroxylase PuuD n=1 Tax=Microvirga antarctica TaxID=2819233 RepID=UPI001B308470|nr:urate hydroxylase PuuD [Microvirga antarctica]
MIDPQISEWIGQLLRWVHVITAIAWIGSSFYFIHLDLSLRKRDGLPPGVSGEAWQVHGGGFYNMRQFFIAPAEMPADLTWFKWESYATWITGFFLLVWVYYLHADLYAIDPAVRELAPWQAGAIGVSALAASWLAYEGLCRSPIGRSTAWLGAALFVYILAAATIFTHLFNGRAAFLHTGAMIATWMSASVFFVIIPNQKKVVADLLAGRVPDPALGLQAKQRSTHNNYLTLPVIFLMLSNHYPLAWSSRFSVGIIAMILIAGALIRHFFNARHAGRKPPYWTWLVAGYCIAVAIWLSIIGKPGYVNQAEIPAVVTTATVAASFNAATSAIQTRCAMCHAGDPSWEGIAIAPKGIVLDTPEAIRRHADIIRVQSVLTHAMPPNNITGMTLEERKSVASWLAQNDALLR